MSVLLEQNLDAVKAFVKMMFDDIKNEVNRLKEENVDLKQSLQFSQEEIANLKTTVSVQNREIKKLREEACGIRY